MAKPSDVAITPTRVGLPRTPRLRPQTTEADGLAQVGRSTSGHGDAVVTDIPARKPAHAGARTHS